MTVSQKLVFSFILALLMSLASLAFMQMVAPAHSMNGSAYAGNKPLMIVRFNQRKVYYERPLYNAVVKAMNAKPDVVFDVISYVPQTQNPEQNQRHIALSTTHMRALADSFMQMGVGANRINMSTQINPALRFDEIHIFIR